MTKKVPLHRLRDIAKQRCASGTDRFKHLGSAAAGDTAYEVIRAQVSSGD